ncbi:cupin domain-containing protein [Streptomyces sp. TLI_171]|uniref:cupin domain-containing protein n=1 Tax=Streptomyces sp. TLI_171 TaxID=1938859 RepID=UPI000C521B1D|nr:cupin domain-containing protein [Streptomyces sp. TLI_171]RKE22365.1 mannose-6-phosphate isomerase-like protein (cupin superfamily) [Streptomyces sp. TLI_171]
MNRIDLPRTAADLPEAWRSAVLGRVAGAELKLLRMDGRPLPPERHDTPEALLVVDGLLRLTVDGADVDLAAGELRWVAAGVEHAVRAGSTGTLLIVEQPAGPPPH